MDEKSKNIKPIINAINNRDDAKKMDELLLQYSQKFSRMKHPDYLPLQKWWDKVQDNTEAGRIFSSVFDIKLSIVLLNYDTIEVSTAWHKVQKASAVDKTPILDQAIDIFYERVHLHRAANAYIIRYRALFDKLMGLMVLLHSADDYKDYIRAKSRKEKFTKIVAMHPNLFPKDSVDNLFTSLKMFDENYRTSEVHASGKLRKYTFSNNSDADRYFGFLTIDVWNFFIHSVRMIDAINVGLDEH